MQPDDIISYAELVAEERANLQKGMNYGIGKTYSVFLMSVRPGAPYRDQIDLKTGSIIYEGHDAPKQAGVDSKAVDQPLTTPSGKWTENGKFFRAAVDFKSGLLKQAHLIRIYEKIQPGTWCYKGVFELVDAQYVSDGKRKVFRYELHPVQKTVFSGRVVVPIRRLIPSEIKREVWKRDGGKCVLCGSDHNLHYDHDIPFSRGGSSIVAENVRLLCAKHNLSKSDKIMSAAILAHVGFGLSVEFYN
jgi:hypothetical protein